VGQDSDLLRRLTRLALGVDYSERTDGVKVSDGEVGGVAALDDHNARVVVVVEGLQVRLSHLLVQDGAGELEEVISWILEQKRVGGVG